MIFPKGISTNFYIQPFFLYFCIFLLEVKVKMGRMDTVF